MQKGVTIITLLFSYFWYSCNEETCNDFNLGNALLSDSTKQFIVPYLNQNKVIFIDSLNNRLSLHIGVEHKVSAYKYQSNNNKDCYDSYSISLETYYIALKDSNLNDYFWFGARTFVPLPNDKIVKTESVEIGGALFQPQSILNLMLNNKLQLNSNIPEQTVLLNNKKYNNVIQLVQNAYFHRQYGLLAFRDSSRRLWVFDRFE